MSTAVSLSELMEEPEGRAIEFKAARAGFQFDELVKYCVAMANEGGGAIVLGVSDHRPREIVGTKAFPEPGRTEAGLFERLHHRVVVEEQHHQGKRVLIVHVPSRLPGTAWQCRGSYWMRAGDALVPMDDSELRRIHAESGTDFSGEACTAADIGSLDPDAIELFRALWQRKAPRQDFRARPVSQLLADAELLVGGKLTFAAIILMGTREALGRFLGQAEIIFEYRSTDAPGPAAERREFRRGFLVVLDEIWQAISLRNDLQHFQQGMFVWDIPTFDERAVREAVLNAVTHRDYRRDGSVFVRQYPRRIEVISPGGFPAGINESNLLWEQSPRNRRLAEALSRCGLVERAGQGFDLIYGQCIRQGKPLPDFTRTSEQSVWLTLHGEIEDPEFLRFLEEVGHERQAAFSTEDFLVIDRVHRDQPVPAALSRSLHRLHEQGIVERVGRGRGTRYLLSRRFYRFLGKPGVYTRRRGLDRGTNKALLLSHVRDSAEVGASLAELHQVLPGLSLGQVRGLVRELRGEGLVEVQGLTRAARWFPVAVKPNSTQS